MRYGILLLVVIAVTLVYAVSLQERDEAAIEGHLARLVNEERASLGTGYLVFDPQLGGLARSYSERMLSEDFFAHNYGVTGEELFTANPDWTRRRFGDAVAENIARTHVGVFAGSCPAFTERQIASCLFELWKESESHYEALVSGAYGAQGLGVSCGLFECRATQYLTPRSALL